jgi:hypothetical protein
MVVVRGGTTMNGAIQRVHCGRRCEPNARVKNQADHYQYL